MCKTCFKLMDRSPDPVADVSREDGITFVFTYTCRNNCIPPVFLETTY